MEPGSWFVCCEGPDCPVEFEAKAASRGLAIAAWNRRTPPFADGWITFSAALQKETKT